MTGHSYKPTLNLEATTSSEVLVVIHQPHDVKCHKTVTIIVNAVRNSNLKFITATVYCETKTKTNSLSQTDLLRNKQAVDTGRLL